MRDILREAGDRVTRGALWAGYIGSKAVETAGFVGFAAGVLDGVVGGLIGGSEGLLGIFGLHPAQYAVHFVDHDPMTEAESATLIAAVGLAGWIGGEFLSELSEPPARHAPEL